MTEMKQSEIEVLVSFADNQARNDEVNAKHFCVCNCVKIRYNVREEAEQSVSYEAVRCLHLEDSKLTFCEQRDRENVVFEALLEYMIQ